MHEKERHRIILSVIESQPVATVGDLSSLTGASEATIRRDIASLHMAKKLRRVRGGAESIHPPQITGLAGRPFAQNQIRNVLQKRAIAKKAVELCSDNDSIIINGGTTTFQMVHHLPTSGLQIYTNSFPIAEHLLKNTKNTMILAGGVVYREQNIILSPFDNDPGTRFYSTRMFMGAQGIGPLGIMEADPLLIAAEDKLIKQADELIVLIDSTKFENRSSLVLCPLEMINIVITDENISDKAASMIENSDIELITAPLDGAESKTATL